MKTDKLRALWRDWRTPFCSALIAGLLAHGYAFANKLLNHDEIESLFGKGATVTSGRWDWSSSRFCFPTGPCPGSTGF